MARQIKLYVAGKYEEHQMIANAIVRLQQAGFEITHDWTAYVKHEQDLTVSPDARETLRKTMARMDLLGAMNCHAMVVFDHPNGKGLYVEMGAALAKDRPVYVIQKKTDCVFHLLPGVIHVQDLEEVVARLKAWEEVNLAREWRAAYAHDTASITNKAQGHKPRIK